MTDAHIPFTGVVRALPASTPFVGPEALERTRGGPFAARIGANESAFGISPKAAAAIEREIARASWYGDPESYELREELAAKHDADEAVDLFLDALLPVAQGLCVHVVQADCGR